MLEDLRPVGSPGASARHRVLPVLPSMHTTTSLACRTEEGTTLMIWSAASSLKFSSLIQALKAASLSKVVPTLLETFTSSAYGTAALPFLKRPFTQPLKLSASLASRFSFTQLSAHSSSLAPRSRGFRFIRACSIFSTSALSEIFRNPRRRVVNSLISRCFDGTSRCQTIPM